MTNQTTTNVTKIEAGCYRIGDWIIGRVTARKWTAHDSKATESKFDFFPTMKAAVAFVETTIAESQPETESTGKIEWNQPRVNFSFWNGTIDGHSVYEIRSHLQANGKRRYESVWMHSSNANYFGASMTLTAAKLACENHWQEINAPEPTPEPKAVAEIVSRDREWINREATELKIVTTFDNGTVVTEYHKGGMLHDVNGNVAWKQVRADGGNIEQNWYEGTLIQTCHDVSYMVEIHYPDVGNETYADGIATESEARKIAESVNETLRNGFTPESVGCTDNDCSASEPCMMCNDSMPIVYVYVSWRDDSGEQQIEVVPA